MSAAARELYSLLIPLRSERLLVPRMCVAEVIPFADADRRGVEGPDWFLGTSDWNGRQVPVIALDAPASEETGTVRRRPSRARIVVFHALTDKVKVQYFGILTQGFPQLVRVNPGVITRDALTPVPANLPALCRVRMIHEFPLIPDLEQIEAQIAELPPPLAVSRDLQTGAE